MSSQDEPLPSQFACPIRTQWKDKIVDENNPFAPPKSFVADSESGKIRPEVSTSSAQEWYLRYWSGQADLWKAFWLVGVLGQILALISIGVASLALRSVLAPFLIYGFSVVAFMGTAVFASVSIWRCAVNARLPHFGALARVAVAFYAGAWLLLIVRANSVGSGA